jgi:NADPH:quinone reductase
MEVAMRAVLCKRFGPLDELEIGEVDAPRPGPGELIVDVRAASVQFVDIRVVEGRSLLNTSKLDAHFGRKLKVELPITPGSEAAGVVAQVGEGVTSLKPGDRVLGTCLTGAWAEKAVFAASEVCRIPDEMDFETAAVFWIMYFTSFYALRRRAALAAGESLLVLGAGSGVGLAAVEIGKAAGAFVMAAASSDEKLRAAAGRGADVLVNYGAGPLPMAAQKELSARFKSAAGARGIDVIADLVGGDYAEPAMRAMSFKARYLSVGFSAGVPAIPMHVIFNKNATLFGIEPVADNRLPGDNLDLISTLFGWFREGKLRPNITERFPMGRASDALKRLAERKAIGRVILTMGNSAEATGAR